MSHFTEGVLQAYLDDEVAADARAQVEAHVTGCGACSTRLQDLRQLNDTFAGAVAVMDEEPLTSAALAEVRTRAARQTWRERYTVSPRSLARAAMLVIGLSAAAAAAVPGSPLRQWLVQTWNSLTEEKALPAPSVTAPAQPELPPTGARIDPVDGRVRIVLESPSPETRIHVVLIDGTKALVEGGAGAKRTSSRPGIVELIGTGAGDLRISLPRTVPHASIEIDGKVILTKEGDSLRYLGATADTVGAELIFNPSN